MNYGGTEDHSYNAMVKEHSLCNTVEKHDPPANVGCTHSSQESPGHSACQSSGYISNLFQQDPDEIAVP